LESSLPSLGQLDAGLGSVGCEREREFVLLTTNHIKLLDDIALTGASSTSQLGPGPVIGPGRGPETSRVRKHGFPGRSPVAALFCQSLPRYFLGGTRGGKNGTRTRPCLRELSLSLSLLDRTQCSKRDMSFPSGHTPIMWQV